MRSFTELVGQKIHSMQQVARKCRHCAHCALYALGTAGLILGTIYLVQNKLLYHPRKYFYDEPYYNSQKYRFRKFLESVGREPMHKIEFKVPLLSKANNWAWYIPPNAHTDKVVESEEEARVLWVVFGGNAMLALDWLPFIREYISHSGTERNSFLLIDYPGYGLNALPELFPSPESILLSSKAAVRYALEKNPSSQVRVLGHSLGCAASLQLAADKELRDELRAKDPPATLDRVVISAPFVSITAMARKIFFPFTPQFLVKHNWDNEAAITTLITDYYSAPECPSSPKLSVTILHGTRDGIVPFDQGQALYHTALDVIEKEGNPDEEAQHKPVTASFVKLSGVGHNDLLHLSVRNVIAAMNEGSTVKSSI